MSKIIYDIQFAKPNYKIERISQLKPETLYHYTSAAALESIVQTDGKIILYATHSKYLNDNNELSTGISLIKEVIDKTPEILNISDDHLQFLKFAIYHEDEFLQNSAYFITCFSESTGIVDQWRGYGSSGYGFALGFDFKCLEDYANTHQRIWFHKCLYEREQQIEAIVNAAARAEAEFGEYSKSGEYDKKNAMSMDYIQFYVTLTEVALQIKHEAFNQEREWRLVVNRNINLLADHPSSIDEYDDLYFRTSSRGLVPYIKHDLPRPTNVLVGPSPDQIGNKDALKMLLRSRSPANCDWIKTDLENIPYRE